MTNPITADTVQPDKISSNSHSGKTAKVYTYAADDQTHMDVNGIPSGCKCDNETTYSEACC